jgi:hypothetical protein
VQLLASSSQARFTLTGGISHAAALQVFRLWRGIVNDLLYWNSHMADQLSSAKFSRIDDVFS